MLRSKPQVMLVGLVGLILFIAGILVATVRGTGLRGSGLGTVLIVIGILALLLAAVRYRSIVNPTQRVVTSSTTVGGTQMSGDSKFCRKCGTKFASNADFCPACGAKQV